MATTQDPGYVGKVFVGKGGTLQAALDSAWEQGKARAIAGADETATRWLRVVDIYIGGNNPINDYRIVAEGSVPPPP